MYQKTACASCTHILARKTGPSSVLENWIALSVQTSTKQSLNYADALGFFAKCLKRHLVIKKKTFLSAIHRSKNSFILSEWNVRFLRALRKGFVRKVSDLSALYISAIHRLNFHLYFTEHTVPTQLAHHRFNLRAYISILFWIRHKCNHNPSQNDATIANHTK